MQYKKVKIGKVYTWVYPGAPNIKQHVKVIGKIKRIKGVIVRTTTQKERVVDVKDLEEFKPVIPPDWI